MNYLMLQPRIKWNKLYLEYNIKRFNYRSNTTLLNIFYQVFVSMATFRDDFSSLV